MNFVLKTLKSCVTLLWCRLEIGEHISKHGDGAKDIAFEVEDLDAIFKVSLCTELVLLPTFQWTSYVERKIKKERF